VDLGAYVITNDGGGVGGNGGDFSGGGGGGASLQIAGGYGGDGGFGAGGGGGGDTGAPPPPYNAATGGNGGTGGFGGGGGGAGGSPDKIYTGAALGGGGGYGGGAGGDGNEGGGGGGAAFGAAVFVRSSNGASVSFTDSSTDAGTLIAGLAGGSSAGGGGANGSTGGGAVFLMGGSATFTVSSAASTQTIAGSIGQSSATSIIKAGPGTLAFTAVNGYSGGTTVTAGMLELVNTLLPSSANNTIASNAVLEYSLTSELFQSAVTLNGTGILRKTGAGKLVFGGSGNVNVDLSAGALVDVEAGTLVGSSSYQGVWTGNLASLNIAGGATFDAVEAGPTAAMQFDALTGTGTFSGGYAGNAGGLSTITIGAAGGSGLFSGQLQDDGGAHLAIIKSGGGTETFTGINTYTGSTTVARGELIIGAAGSLPGGSNVTVGSPSTTGELQLAAGAGPVALSSLVINSGSTVDIISNVMTVNFTPGNDPAATIRGYLQTGYSGDTWSGAGIVSSIAAANPGLYAVGYADGNTDSGTPAAANQVYIRNTLAGDANLDGIVNFPDLLLVAQNYGKTGEDWAHGDFNYDGIVNFPDLLLVAQNYGKQLSAGQLAQLPGSFAAQWQLAEAEIQIGGQSNNVPEPAANILALFGTGLLAGRRRKSSRK
jgi:autotransporter-associated beta strand protein